MIYKNEEKNETKPNEAAEERERKREITCFIIVAFIDTQSKQKFREKKK